MIDTAIGYKQSLHGAPAEIRIKRDRMSLRITGGQARGRSIESPQGLDVRPTSSKIRQSLFNILGARVSGANFLDLFAGSGLMGMEALSRGAGSLIAVEESGKLAGAIEKSLERLSLEGEVIRGDVRDVVNNLPKLYFDIVFADPPYKSSLAKTVVQLVAKKRILKPDGILLVEHHSKMELVNLVKPRSTEKSTETINAADSQSDGGSAKEGLDLVLVSQRHYGQTCVSFFAPSESY